MRLRLFTFLAATAAFILVSCTKNTDGDTNPTAGSGNLLKQFIRLDTAQPAPYDTLSIDTYTYDNQNRCIKIVGQNFQFYRNYKIENYYNGSDSRIVTRKLINMYADSTMEFIKYDASGQLIGDSTFSYNGSTTVGSLDIRKHILLNNTVTTTRPISGGPSVAVEKHILTKDAYGNITQDKDSSFTSNSVSGVMNFNHVTTTQTVYDTHPNPFYDLYPKRPADIQNGIISDDVLIGVFGHLQKNNPTSLVSVSLPTTSWVDYNYSWKYIYNTNGYPASVSFKDLSYIDYFKGVYIYY